jgi:hypothetical protein
MTGYAPWPPWLAGSLRWPASAGCCGPLAGLGGQCVAMTGYGYGILAGCIVVAVRFGPWLDKYRLLPRSVDLRLPSL